ncbi:MAG TPA: flagellar hook-length control protein FliK, partial [bacterium]|nr:flagellar hook-length control protein FliK [bacterium]
LKTIVDKAAQEAGLNAEEKSALANLAAAALPRLTAFKAETLSKGTPATTDGVGGEQPGPQGGSPATAAIPADSLSSAPTRKTQQNITPTSIASLAQQLLSPVVVSTRTDDGSSATGSVSLASAGTARSQSNPGALPLTPAPLTTDPKAAVITLAGGASNEASAPAAPQGTAPAAATAQPQEPIQTEAVPSLLNQAAAEPAMQITDPQVEVLPLGQDPLPVQADSVISLNGNGEWSGSKELVALAKASAEQPQAPAVTGTIPSQPQTPPVAGKPQPQAQDPAVTGTTPSQPPVPAVPGTPPQIQAPAVTGTTPSQPQARVADTAPQAQAVTGTTPPQPQAQVAAATVPTTAAPSIPAVTPQAQPQTSQPAAATVPQTPQPEARVAAAPAPLQATLTQLAQLDRAQPAPNNAQGGGSAPQTTVGQLAWTSQNTPSSRMAGGPGAFVGLAQVGQDAASPKDLVTPDMPQQNVVQQVTQALQDAQANGNSRLLIHLKPEGLGDVQVDLLMSNGKLTARLVAATPEVHQAFVRDLSGFKTGLESHGVSVQEVSVALRSGLQDQPQGQPRQPQDQSWWSQDQNLNQGNGGASLPQAGAGYGGQGLSIDQRFSALA